MAKLTTAFAEQVKSNDDVEILFPATPVRTDDGTGKMIGTASITRTVIRNYKTGEATGEKHVHLVFTPVQGRAEKMRLQHAIDALGALGLLGAEDDGEDGEES